MRSSCVTSYGSSSRPRLSISGRESKVPDSSAQVSEIARSASDRMKKTDQRIRQTRLRLLRAFNTLILERGYAKMTVGDVIERAAVVRSTFYEHFETKDDILRQSLVPVFSILADVLVEPDV